MATTSLALRQSVSTESALRSKCSTPSLSAQQFLPAPLRDLSKSRIWAARRQARSHSTSTNLRAIRHDPPPGGERRGRGGGVRAGRSRQQTEESQQASQDTQ